MLRNYQIVEKATIEWSADTALVVTPNEEQAFQEGWAAALKTADATLEEFRG